MTYLFLFLNVLSLPLYSAGKCGTAFLYSEGQSPLFLLKNTTRQNLVSIKNEIPARRYISSHFTFYYELKGTHAVHFEDGDKSITAVFDSIYNSLSSSLSDATKREQSYQKMDELKIGHPSMVQAYVKYFESAYESYVTLLGMKSPVAPSTSLYYKHAVPASTYPIEIVDIASTDPGLVGVKVYGLTNRIAYGGGIQVENDFWDYGTEAITSSPSYDASLNINYTVEWEKGVEVTAIHEFYHAIQFAYTPNPNSFHYWYELSASGVEEQFSKNVNDYFQYLPFVFSNPSAYTLNDPCFNCLDTYGRGIFYTFLTSELGMGFDKSVWTKLQTNNRIDSVLQEVFAENNKTMLELFPKYTVNNLNNGTSTPLNVTDYTPDRKNWPVLPIKKISSTVLLPKSYQISNLAYDFIEIDSSYQNEICLLRLSRGKDVMGTLIASNKAGKPLVVTKDIPALINLENTGTGKMFLHLANAAWKDTAMISIDILPRVTDTVVRAFPNLLSKKQSNRLLFSTTTDSLVSMIIFNAQGDTVRNLQYLGAQDVWTWDLKDSKGKEVVSGAYFYKTDKDKLQAVYIQ